MLRTPRRRDERQLHAPFQSGYVWYSVCIKGPYHSIGMRFFRKQISRPSFLPIHFFLTCGPQNLSSLLRFPYYVRTTVYTVIARPYVYPFPTEDNQRCYRGLPPRPSQTFLGHSSARVRSASPASTTSIYKPCVRTTSRLRTTFVIVVSTVSITTLQIPPRHADLGAWKLDERTHVVPVENFTVV